MKETTKRILSLILAFVMVLGLLPGLSVNVSAAEDVIDAAIFCSDVHGNPSTVTSVFNGIKSADSTFAPSTASFVGDTQCASSSVTSAAQSVFPGVGCYYAFGNHDDEGNYGISDVTGLIYGDSTTNYYIYAISENSMASSNPDTSGFTRTVAGLDKTKPLFIISHLPLHSRRGDSNGAAVWYPAISAAADEMDIFFFWAHNHTGDNATDQAAYYVAKDGSEKITLEDTSTVVTPNFTYANTGYIDPPNNPARNNVATAVRIYEDSVNLTVYNASGELSGTYAVNETVAREFASAEPEATEPSVPETTAPEETTVPETTAPEETTVPETTAPEETTVPETTDPTEDGIPAPETATGSGSTTTTTKKTVYVLTSSISSGNEYLIVNGNSAGSCYALANNSGSVAATGVTVKSGDVDGDGDNETYIELDDAADELWTTSGSSSTTLTNNGYYLRYSSGLGLSTRSSTSWSWSSSNNRLSYSVKYGRDTYTYYLRYSNGWQASTTSGNVYFYVPTEVEVETTTTVSGTYSIEGTPAEVTKVVTAGATATLGSTLTFVPTDGGTATTTDTSTTATYEIYSDPDGILSGIDGNTVTFTGSYGEALVKVSYEVSFGEEKKTVTNYITVTATEPTYVLDITSGGNVVTGTTIAKKGVTDGMTLQLGTQIQFVDEDGGEIVELPEGATIQWNIPEEYHSIATVDQNTGLVTFKGVDGAFYVTATLTVGDKDYTVGVNISATTSQYSTPTDGTGDFPEYPNEGAIRFDKTGTAVGNFSETGIAQIELSMTGVPYTTGSEIDVVIMLDMTGSMSDTAMTAAEESAIAFAEQIVKNTDGTYNQNRIAVLAFNSGSASPYTLWPMGVVEEDNWSSFCTNVRTASDKQVSGGTPYDEALEECQSVLQAAKTDGIGNDRQQFCVFVSDGGPTSYQYITNYDAVKAGTASAYTTKTASASGGSNQSDSNFATIATYTHEYYSTLMKDDGVTMYSVLTGLVAANYPNCTTIMQNIASDSTKAFVVENGNDTSSLTNAFTNIAAQIMQAATDVTVEDKITDEYTMIFDIPEGSKDITGVTNDFYIEFGKYALDENHERTTFTSVTKLYLQNTNGVLSAKDSTDPVFEQKTIGDKGTLYYWTTDDSYAPEAAVTYTNSEVTYYFIPYGMKSTDSDYDADVWFNMTSGAYAHGTVDSTTNMSEDLVIATPYFVYNASDKMIYWTVDKLDTYEYTLSYFLYLNNSATEVATSNETDPGPYPTNDHAYITYTNFQGNDCRQVFPIPQLTWNGAQVSYVFYLVNAQGQPINKSGQVVDFANATFITDVYTEAVVWNKAGDTTTGTGELSADWLAVSKLPEEYDIYDEQARYVLNVYENADGTTIKNQFTISGDTAANISSSLNTRLNLDTTANTVSVSTTKVYNTKAGEKISAYGTYTSADSNMTGFDFANTTVAFAVVWQPRLVPDVVVVDYGLDVLINVVQNDILQNKVTGIGKGNSAYGTTAMNTGVVTESKLGTAALTIDGNTISIENETSVRFHQGDMEFEDAVTFYYETPVEFWEGSDPTEGFMYSSVTVIPATTIYYEDEFVDFRVLNSSTWEETSDAAWETVTDGSSTTAVQDQDRPGESLISGAIDADNIYGYDSAYENCSKYSLGSAHKLHVTEQYSGEMIFTFYGTGFDVISLTSNTTGTIIVDLYDPAQCWDGSTFNYEGLLSDGSQIYGGTIGHDSLMVDTYYGYTYKEVTVENEDGTTTTEKQWVPVDINDPNALYQVPVIKMEDLPYGKYTAVITAGYNTIFDHDQYADNSYDFYLDAIRIYDPANDGVVITDEGEDTTIRDAYVADDEGWPAYTELRNMLISAQDFRDAAANADEVPGIIFIDGDTDLENSDTITGSAVGDYANFGPNNELYLAPGQAVAFKLNAGVWTTDADGTQTLDDSEIAKVRIGLKSVGLGADDGTTAAVRIYDATTNLEDVKQTLAISTATDMYYDITDLNGKVVVIHNDAASGTILSITNLKVTFKNEPEDEMDLASMMENLVTIDGDSGDQILRSVNNEIPEPEVEEPVVFAPESFSVSLNKSSLKVGQKVRVAVTTSSEVDYVVVNGQQITSHSTNRWTGLYTWTVTLTAEEVGTMVIETVAYNADGTASEAITQGVTVKSASNWWDWIW